MVKRSILITGATGHLGSQILKLILLKSNSYVNLLIRAGSKAEAEIRLKKLIEQINCKIADFEIRKRVSVFRGDITEKNLGLSKKDLMKLYNEVEEIYHCAAITGFSVPIKSAQMVNVNGSKHLLSIADRCHQLTRFNFISTTFILGNKEHTLKEDDLDIGQKFNNAYEQSKFEAELLISKYNSNGLIISIFRPSVIVGNYSTGETLKFKMFYESLRIMSSGLFDSLPVNLEVVHNLIPADIAAKAIYTLASNERVSNTYHIISSNNVSCYDFMRKAALYFGYKNPKWIRFDKFDINRISAVQRIMLGPFLPYFNYKGKYSAKQTHKILKKYNVLLPEINDQFLNRMFQYCLDVGYIRTRNTHIQP